MASKKIVLCDTNVIIQFLKDDTYVIQNFEAIGKESIYISTITAAELYYGAKNKIELNKIIKKLQLIVNIPINEHISDIFDQLMKNYSLSHKLAIPDAIIAATALYYDIDLYTFNTKDFRFIKDVKLFIH